MVRRGIGEEACHRGHRGRGKRIIYQVLITFLFLCGLCGKPLPVLLTTSYLDSGPAGRLGCDGVSEGVEEGSDPMAETIQYEDFAKLELRVAKVLEARPHPNADKLLLLQVDVGDEQKQIVAGIRQHYAPEQLVGRRIIVVNNLAPAMLRGEASNGMLLAATSGEKVVLLAPDDPDCVVGAKVK
ncbi:MAG TPA: methionine--tRNA ligase subunit beta [Isosphaeraceae bacterium]|nr:methionine--tRNA ligase subunit beta [Isosphaeraceae bacterium]